MVAKSFNVILVRVFVFVGEQIIKMVQDFVNEHSDELPTPSRNLHNYYGCEQGSSYFLLEKDHQVQKKDSIGQFSILENFV